MAYSVSQKLQDNLHAIHLALDYQNGHPLNADAIDSLKKYAGFGGIKAILYPYGTPEEWQANGATKEDLKHHEAIIQLHELLQGGKRCNGLADKYARTGRWFIHSFRLNALCRQHTI